MVAVLLSRWALHGCATESWVVKLWNMGPDWRKWVLDCYLCSQLFLCLLPASCLPTFLCHVIPLNCFSFSMAHSKGNQGWEDWNLSDLESNLSSFGLVTFYWCQQTLDKGNLGRKFFFSWYQRVQSIVRLVPCAWEGYHSSKNVGGSPEWNRKWPEITCTPMFTPKRPTIPEQCHHLGPRIHIMTL